MPEAGKLGNGGRGCKPLPWDAWRKGYKGEWSPWGAGPLLQSCPREGRNICAILLGPRVGNSSLKQGRVPWSKHTGIGAHHLHGAMHGHWSQHRLLAQPGTGTGFGSRGVDDSEWGRMWKMQPGHNAT